MAEASLQGFFSEVLIEVAWGDMDAWQHVNNTMYFRYLETARMTYLRDLGWASHEARGLLPVLASVSAKFLRPVLFPSTLRVATRPIDLREARFTLEHHMFLDPSGSALLATLGTSVVVPFDRSSARAARIPDDVRARIAAQLSAP